MCGLAGVLDRDGLRREDADVVRGMTLALRHRGPDDTGSWSDPDSGIAFGFRRLAILDTSSAGHQPMASSSGRFVMVFNGEVYDFRELRQELEGDGFRFRGGSDTEVMLAAFERWGVEGAVERFVGMFAIALWDRRERTLHLIRDRMGIKPLYYHVRGSRISFASELKALRRDPRMRTALDLEALTAYLRYLYVPAPRTIFLDTYKLRPGHVLSVRLEDDHVAESRPYWSLPDVVGEAEADPLDLSDEEAVAELDRLLTDAVGIRLRSDVPLGALLSGGIDSSTVVSFMQELSPRPVRTFTIGFDDPEHDEAGQASAVAEHLGTEHTELTVHDGDVLAVVPMLTAMFDEPFADPSEIPTYLVSRLARQSVTVALSGDGGDEVFGGYNRYISGARMIPWLERLPAAARKAGRRVIQSAGADRWSELYERALQIGIVPSDVRMVGEKVHKVGRLLEEPSADLMYQSLLSSTPDPRDLLAEGVGEDAAPFPDLLDEGFPASLLHRMMLADQLTYLPDDLLAKVDRASMAVSLEVRVPILDHRIVRFGWRIPDHQKIRDGTGKWLLRQVLYRRVPRDLVERPKVGFSVPIAQWLRGPLREWAEALLGEDALRREGVLAPEAVRERWSRFLSGASELALGLWAVLLYRAWAEHE